MAEKIGTMLLQMAVSLIILRLLTRDILGVMATVSYTHLTLPTKA